MPEEPAAAPVLEHMEFGPLGISFDHRVLRPRPWVADQSRWTAELAAEAPDGPMLEVCCGAGHIGLLAAHLTGRSLVAVDIDPVACAFARLNAVDARLHSTVEVREGPMDEVLELHEQFVLIVADPPWVRTDDVARYPDDPLLAIDGGADGTEVLWACLDVIAGHLAPGGSAVIQLGTTEQVALVAARLDEHPASSLMVVDVRDRPDQNGVLALLRHP